jgi:phospholipid-binding lipoprotein MlaA
MRFLLLLCFTAFAPFAAADEQTDGANDVKDPGFYGERIPRIDFMDVSDPWQRFNRGVYVFNAQFDRFVFLPALRVYHVIPKFARTGIHNFWENLNEVQNLTGSLLQLKGRKTINTIGRFVINTTIGIGGLFDVATKIGIPSADEDFGQVLGHWGVPQGPYLVIPFLGPSNLRDGFGKLADAEIALAVNLFEIPEERSENPWVFIAYALDTRDAVDFRYGQLQSPFEYEMVRFAVSEARRIMVEADESSARAAEVQKRLEEYQLRSDQAETQALTEDILQEEQGNAVFEKKEQAEKAAKQPPKP